MTEQIDRAALEQQVIERAGSDPEFRRDLIRDPRGTMEREYGLKVPDRIEMIVLEETPSSVHLVLPPAGLQPGQEVSEADLEAVSGGGYTGEGFCPTPKCDTSGMC